jgi:hypothetical protein
MILVSWSSCNVLVLFILEGLKHYKMIKKLKS